MRLRQRNRARQKRRRAFPRDADDTASVLQANAASARLFVRRVLAPGLRLKSRFNFIRSAHRLAGRAGTFF
jgi:hypothetical protein